MKLTALAVAFVAFLSSLAASADADVTHVAVAANFTEPAKEIAALFKQKTGHEASADLRRVGRLLHSDHP